MTSQAIRYNKKREEPVCWCKGAYATHLTKLGYKITQMSACRRNPVECFGSHTEKIKKKPFIDDWEKKDKTSFDLLKLVQGIISQAKQMKDTVNNTELSKQITNIDNMSFEDIVSFWHDFECHYGAIKKKLPWKSQGHSDKTEENYHYKEDVPSLKIAGFIEDDIWAFERSLHICDSHFDVMDNKDTCHSMDDICVGGYCCKWGVHALEQFACLQNLKDGKCDCLSSEDIIKMKQVNNIRIDELRKQLTSSVDSDGWEIKLTEKVKKTIMDEISKLNSENNKLCRKVHYTEKGMIPYNVRLAEANKTTKFVDLRNMEVKKVMQVVRRVVK
jgi:hypothetical protein